MHGYIYTSHSWNSVHMFSLSAHVFLTVPSFFVVTFWPGHEAKNSLCSSTLRSSRCILDSNCTHRGEAVRPGCLLEVEVILNAFLQKGKKVKTLLSRPFFLSWNWSVSTRPNNSVHRSCYCSKNASTKSWIWNHILHSSDSDKWLSVNIFKTAPCVNKILCTRIIKPLSKILSLHSII